MIKAVTIDFWNTLFDSSNGKARNDMRMKTLLEQIDKHGIWIKQDEFDKAMKASWGFFNEIWRSQMRTPSALETVQFFWKYLDLPHDENGISIVAESFSSSLLEHPPAPIEGAKDIVGQLADKYKLGMISDTGFSPGTVLRQILNNNGILKFFEVFSFSDETGVAKPNERAFSTAVYGLRTKPDETVHIGDIEDTDVKGAKYFGMKAIRFSGDKTGVFVKENPKLTMADAEVYSWDEVPEILEGWNLT